MNIEFDEFLKFTFFCFLADIFELVRDSHTNMHMIRKRTVSPTIRFPQKNFFLGRGENKFNFYGKNNESGLQKSGKIREDALT